MFDEMLEHRDRHSDFATVGNTMALWLQILIKMFGSISFSDIKESNLFYHLKVF
jgi:hypothetical protein